jgi:hypothetical protein
VKIKKEPLIVMSCPKIVVLGDVVLVQICEVLSIYIAKLKEGLYAQYKV